MVLFIIGYNHKQGQDNSSLLKTLNNIKKRGGSCESNTNYLDSHTYFGSNLFFYH